MLQIPEKHDRPRIRQVVRIDGHFEESGGRGRTFGNLRDELEKLKQLALAPDAQDGFELMVSEEVSRVCREELAVVVVGALRS